MGLEINVFLKLQEKDKLVLVHPELDSSIKLHKDLTLKNFISRKKIIQQLLKNKHIKDIYKRQDLYQGDQ